MREERERDERWTKWLAGNSRKAEDDLAAVASNNGRTGRNE